MSERQIPRVTSLIAEQDVHRALENPMVDTSMLEEFLSSDLEFGTL